jgi:ATP-dependent helicase/nuclease subunit A
MTELRTRPSDQSARDQALDTRSSYIVQAPAGSGKTELLTHRFLKLLATVDEPEEILAITFTRAATAEMRSRVIKKLQEARSKSAAQLSGDQMFISARAALTHAQARGWNLLEQPQRLNIQTIDSLCMRIAHEQPLLARMGGHLQPLENALPLYEEAARRTIANLGGHKRELHAALMHLLQLRDNNLPDSQRLIAEMLAHRDQWLHAFPLMGEVTEDDWDAIRMQLEAPFRQAIRRVLQKAHSLLSAETVVVTELIELANYACKNPNALDLGAIAHLRTLPEPTEKFLEPWLCFCSLLLKKSSGRWRKYFTTREGFPPAHNRKKESTEQKYKDRMLSLIGRLSQTDQLLESLCAARRLPPARYDEDQWQILRDLFTVLRYAVAELRVLFAEQNVVDFIELGISAHAVLEQEHLTERALAVSDRIRHLLVDEFQDTSRRQHKLVEMLLRAWSPGDGRSSFFVGDPMQSIYMFRQAEVELFEHVRQHGIVSAGQQHPCIPLQLSANFRSHAGLTEPLNAYFDTIFSGAHAAGAAAVSFSPSEAVSDALPDPSVCLHSRFLPGLERGRPDRDACDAEWQHEAEEVIAIIEKHLPRIAEAAADPSLSYTIAVLARARQHLTLIAQKLREHDIPYRSVELETLAERQEIRDLLSLIRALLHPMDRIAWLSVLRAPWCGLMLQDLHILCGEDDKQFALNPILQLIEDRLPLLSEDGQQRLRRVSATVRRALEVQYQQVQSPSLSSWIERTWHSLGGPLCLDEQQQENVRVFFSMLDEVALDGIACLGDQFDNQLSRLFAQPDPRASERFGVQLMTIHKAKGLGFDVVLVPGLERSTGRDRQQLICMLERVGIDNPNEDELLVAPIGSKGGEQNPLYQWVQKQRALREAEERKRIFYVACTRARRELHLFGTAVVTGQGELQPGSSDSLLASAWPALEAEFVAAYLERNQINVIPFPGAQQMGILDLAATAGSSHPPLVLRRLPADTSFQAAGTNVTVESTFSRITEELDSSERPEGSRLQRTVGSIIHSLLEQLSRHLEQNSDSSPNTIRPLLQPQVSAMLRAAAVPPEQALSAANDILATVGAAAADQYGRWILSAHPEAQSEASWTGWLDSGLRTLRADRIFRAGAEPLSAGSEYFWVVDYKTAQYAGNDVAGFLSAQRKLYEPQLAQYGRALRKLHGDTLQLRFGLYFPRLGRLEYWPG